MQAPLTDKIDKPAFDTWTPVHLTVGLILGLTQPSRPTAYGLISIFELMEPDFWPNWRESKINIATDLVVGFVGYEIGRVARRQARKQLRRPR